MNTPVLIQAAQPVTETESTAEEATRRNRQRTTHTVSKYANNYKKQLAFRRGVGLVCMLIVNLFSYERLGPFSYLPLRRLS